MFKKILIANRGEIACRIIATAKRLGIQTVAVYSEADVNSKHVALADEAYLIGPAPVSESYLLGEKIIKCAINSGAQAIHPGYGFLSENPDFVRDVEKAGLTFIGPSVDAIKAMGLKDAAKVLMVEAGVPVVPGYHGENQDPRFLAKEADKIGYPVLIKARAGGGGKGMRLVDDPAKFQENLEAAQREAQSSFGDPHCLIEKYITSPRHIEVQVFGDNHGNVVHLYERDCSLQRRHQKVIEEAPAPGMSDGVRNAMCNAAIEAAKAIKYCGAGTIEFIVDGSGPLREEGFWFMEMNTRLQVEHPVSEAITGLDFVELQLRVASGEVLPISQDELSIDGWSFEARVYAEDVPKGFLPASGHVEYLASSEASEFTRSELRIDSGIRQGDGVSPFYDPMIAKVIVHGATREMALNKLTSALKHFRVGGLVTNLQFLSALSMHEGFSKGQVDTNLIARDLEELTKTSAPSEAIIGLAALASLGFVGSSENSNKNAISTTDPLFGWRHWSTAHHKTKIVLGEDEIERKVLIDGNNTYTIEEGENSLAIEVESDEQGDLTVTTNNHRFTCHLNRRGNSIEIFYDGASFIFSIPNLAQSSEGDDNSDGAIIAPLSGTVAKVDVIKGDKVRAGDPLLVLEAMKMEHALTAPCDGVVEDVLFAQGDQVQDGALLVKLATEKLEAEDE